ncbi:putative inner membrane transporter, YdcZ family [Campylobacter avium LMG 24591]|uniref:Putative inner membrane transporter, YdcZ family n=1 Tax=Campylobacter avium LMG 24591 TaxID=522484 RepID=A0A222N0B4_9BACT|nr:DMT family transporter [Campylobacter avium]ASQ31252.1 putative inner membrane transporter, YdcZ family [Campylobacter avium LMG 24591]OYD79926.1 putative inner membrane transporter, YdcZ family [Campylobacter avium]
MFYYIMALFIGVALAVQVPINAALGRSVLNAHLVAAFVNFFVGTLCLLVIIYFAGLLNASVFKLSISQEWWKYLGGVLGAFIVFAAAFLAPKIGLTNMFLMLVLGQIITGMLLDRMGAFSLAVKEISLFKICGLAIIFIGLFIFFYKELFPKS